MSTKCDIIAWNKIRKTRKLINNGILIANKLFLELPISQLSRIVNGCGAADAKFDFVPEKVYGLTMTPVCHIHDLDYELGDTAEEKEAADYRFLINGFAYIKYKSSIFKAFFRRRRWLKYYEAVLLKGDDAFFNDALADTIEEID